MRSYAVLPFDDQLAWKWAELTVAAKKSGNELSWSDSWIAATALRHNLPLISHNGKHFEKVQGVTLISEKRENV